MKFKFHVEINTRRRMFRFRFEVNETGMSVGILVQAGGFDQYITKLCVLEMQFAKVYKKIP